MRTTDSEMDARGILGAVPVEGFVDASFPRKSIEGTRRMSDIAPDLVTQLDKIVEGAQRLTLPPGIPERNWRNFIDSMGAAAAALKDSSESRLSIFQYEILNTMLSAFARSIAAPTQDTKSGSNVPQDEEAVREIGRALRDAFTVLTVLKQLKATLIGRSSDVRIRVTGNRTDVEEVMNTIRALARSHIIEAQERLAEEHGWSVEKDPSGTILLFRPPANSGLLPIEPPEDLNTVEGLRKLLRKFKSSIL